MSGPKWCIPIDNHKILYIQIPKCANTSILRSLSSISEWGVNEEELNHYEFHRAMKSKKVRISNESLVKYQDYYKFTFVRNPWDRAVSCWNDKVKNRKENFSGFVQHGLHDRNISFLEYARRIINIPDSVANDHIRSQNYCIKNNKDVIIDWYGKVENIDEDWTKLSDMIYKRNNVTLFPLSKSNSIHRDKSNFLEYYCEESYDLISSRYKDDIDIFKYQKETL